jgi:hypothetical protein
MLAELFADTDIAIDFVAASTRLLPTLGWVRQRVMLEANVESSSYYLIVDWRQPTMIRGFLLRQLQGILQTAKRSSACLLLGWLPCCELPFQKKSLQWSLAEMSERKAEASTITYFQFWINYLGSWCCGLA